MCRETAVDHPPPKQRQSQVCIAELSGGALWSTAACPMLDTPCQDAVEAWGGALHTVSAKGTTPCGNTSIDRASRRCTE